MNLHVANGDAVVPHLSLQVSGTIIPWGEALMEGPLVAAVANEAFWAVRRNFIHEAYDGSTEEYDSKIIGAFNRITEVGAWERITLWFDADLWCVVNCTFLIHHLQPSAVRGTVCIWPLVDASRGLVREEIDECANLWRAYATGNLSEIESICNQQRSASMHDIYSAFQAHLRRLPAEGVHRGWPVETLIQLRSQGLSDEQIVSRFLADHNTEYGYGDVQVRAMVTAL